jgi:hypothetical protein
VLYGTFLGTEGVAYRWMRRYGVVVYFGATCIAMLIVSGAVQGLVSKSRRVAGTLYALCVALPLLGLVNTLTPWFGARAANHRRAAEQHRVVGRPDLHAVLPCRFVVVARRPIRDSSLESSFGRGLLTPREGTLVADSPWVGESSVTARIIECRAPKPDAQVRRPGGEDDR